MTKRIKTTIKTVLCLLLAGALCLSLAACSPIFNFDDGGETTKPAVEHIGHITIGTTAVPEDVNILSRSGSMGLFSYTCAVNAPLFVRGEFHRIRGYFALDYAVSDDATEIRIAFPTTFKWHDGEPVTLDDVMFTLEYRRDVLKDEALASFKEVRKTADNQAVIVFSAPDAYRYLRSESALDGLLPKHVWQNVTAEQAAEYKGAGYNVGCGPYKVTKVGSDTVELELFPGNDYLGEARVDSITIRTYTDKTALMEALAAHDIDYIYEYDSPYDYTQAELFAGLEGIDPGSFFGADMDVAVFGTELPCCSVEEFRKAVLLSIDWEAVKELCCADTGRVPSGGLLSPSAMGFDDSPETFVTDREEAARQLDKAGFADRNDDGVRELPDGRNFSFRIASQALPERQELYDKIGAVIVKGLKEIGIRAVYLGSVTDADDQQAPQDDEPAAPDAQEDGETAEERPGVDLTAGFGLVIGRTESGKDMFRTAAAALAEEGRGWQPVSDAVLSELLDSLALATSDDQYTQRAKALQQQLAKDAYGFALCWEEYFFPYRTDEFEGQSFLPDTGEVNYMLFYKIKKK